MAGYRSAFIRASSLLSAVLPVKAMVRRSRQNLFLPVYHLVSDQPPAHVRNLYTIKSEREFTRDLEQLLKFFTPVSYPELKEKMEQGRAMDKPSFLLSFDDGLTEFYEVIAPILKKKGIPAINFLNSDFIGNKDLFFRYKVSLLIESINNDIHVIYSDKVRKWMAEHAVTGQKSVVNTLMDIRFDQKDTLDELASILGVDFKNYLQKQKPYMDSVQVNALVQQGFHFGAHSCNHPEYRFIDLPEQLRQTRESVTAVVRQFSLDYAIFAFPFTDYGVSSEFFKQLNQPGKIVDMTFGSAALKKDPVPFHLQRVPMEMGKLDAEHIIRGEYLYYLLKGIVGKNRIERI